jgi:hypothetical protein
VRPLAHEVPGKRGKNPFSGEENTREQSKIIPLLEGIGFRIYHQNLFRDSLNDSPAFLFAHGNHGQCQQHFVQLEPLDDRRDQFHGCSLHRRCAG